MGYRIVKGADAVGVKPLVSVQLLIEYFSRAVFFSIGPFSAMNIHKKEYATLFKLMIVDYQNNRKNRFVPIQSFRSLLSTFSKKLRFTSTKSAGCSDLFTAIVIEVPRSIVF